MAAGEGSPGGHRTKRSGGRRGRSKSPVPKLRMSELLDEDNALSSNLGYAFENLITPLLDDFLIDDKESVNLESTFQEMQNIMPFTLAGLSNDITAGILYGNQLYRLKNNIKLNEVSLPSGILLQKNENPIMSFKRIGCYSLNIKTKYRGRSTGGSYKLSSKLIIRHSEHRGRPISYSEWDFIGNGQLVLTNKHIYFLGDGSARDHGYLFKIHHADLDKLFPKPKHFSL